MNSALFYWTSVLIFIFVTIAVDEPSIWQLINNDYMTKFDVAYQCYYIPPIFTKATAKQGAVYQIQPQSTKVIVEIGKNKRETCATHLYNLQCDTLWDKETQEIKDMVANDFVHPLMKQFKSSYQAISCGPGQTLIKDASEQASQSILIDHNVSNFSIVISVKPQQSIYLSSFKTTSSKMSEINPIMGQFDSILVYMVSTQDEKTLI